ncbi:MAG: ABC transporter permease [Lachnospiraceae bacterium]|jgi:ABC-type Na+ efflux pump permease subunit|nr:ABC transporter permease [Lachnospiraceae bacterium]
MKTEMLAIIKKDLKSVTLNKRLYISLFIVPILLTLVVPTIFVLAIHLSPDDLGDLEPLLKLLPASGRPQELPLTLLHLLFNYLMPVFFLLIPIMAASITAASSFVGEKEKRTLETLLYSPLSLEQIFRSKVAASFILSMSVSLISFFVMLLVLETEASIFFQSFLIPGLQWLVILLLLSPAISLIAITLIVRVSAKAHSMEDAQQWAIFLIFPLILLIAGQFTGILLISAPILLVIGLLCTLAAYLLLKKAAARFTYERLLQDS